MLPWYLRPIQPSRVVPPWVGRILPSVLVLAFFASFLALLGVPTPDAFPKPMYLFVPLIGWASVASGLVRRRSNGGRCPGFSLVGQTLLATAMTVFALPALLWPRWSDLEPLTAVVSITSLLCWCSAGILAAVGIYCIWNHTHKPAGRRATLG